MDVFVGFRVLVMPMGSRQTVTVASDEDLCQKLLMQSDERFGHYMQQNLHTPDGQKIPLGKLMGSLFGIVDVKYAMEKATVRDSELVVASPAIIVPG